MIFNKLDITKNKYYKWYVSIINNCKNRNSNTKEYYLEKHHVLPKCMKGNNSKENLVYLFPKEHFIVHHLLIKFVKNKNYNIKLSHAFWRMCNHANYNIKINSKIYEKLRLFSSVNMKKITKNYIIKEYLFCDPNNKIITIKNLNKFCRDNELCSQAMYKVYKGKIKSHKGYRNIENKDYIPKNKIIKKLINPEGNIVEFYEVKKFCKNNKLSYSKIIDVLNEKQFQHKGYRNIKSNDFIKHEKIFEFYDVENNLIKINDLVKYCKEHKLNYSGMIQMLNGKYSNHKGYHINT